MTTQNVKPNDIKTDELMAFIMYGKVKQNNRGNRIRLANVDDGTEFFAEGRELIEKSFSADQYNDTVKLGKQALAEKLIHAYNRPLTVCFTKTDGTDRVLRGRLIEPEPLLGRSMVEDLDLDGSNKLRLVDHRTIKYLVIDGVKFVAK
jgi:hypothetical protein